MRLPTLKWDGDALELIDQTLLPRELVVNRLESAEEVHDAIRRLVVRGAPAIGVAGAYGVLLAARDARDGSVEEMRRRVRWAGDFLTTARPTAVNLAWACRRMTAVAEEKAAHANQIYDRLEREARAVEEEDREANRRMGKFGAALLHDGAAILTHCNAGALATVDYGTAQGIIYAAAEEGKNISCYVDETRPLLQGARLTAWELTQAGIPATLICDDMAAAVMSQRKVDYVIVGADRIASNGDVANKIGTLNLAILARHFLIPFYVAAPLSTVDFDIASGKEIPIEERDPEEVTSFAGVRAAPVGVDVYNPAFDVTPARLVDAIVTDVGVAKFPLGTGLAVLRREAGA